MRSLSYKIGFGYLIIISINIAIAAFAIYHISDLSRPIDRLLKEKYQNVSAAENMLQTLSQQELIQLSMIEDGLDSTLSINFQIYKNEFFNWHQRAIEGIALASEPEILDSLFITFKHYLLLSDSLQIMLRELSNYNLIRAYHSQKIFPLIINIEMLTSKLRDINEAAIAEAENKSKSISGRANFLIITFSVILIIFSILASYYFARSIILPLKKTTETVRKIGRGHLHQKVNITTDDEIAELGIEFNRMTQRLEAYEKMNITQILLEKRKSEALVNNMPVPIIITDEQDRLFLLNELAKSILQIRDKEWQGKRVNEIVPNQKVIDYLYVLNDLNSTKIDPEKSLINIKRGRAEFFYSGRLIFMTDAEDKFIGKVTILQDVTAFKKLDRLKSEFIAKISHEIKTPLTSMNMAIDILDRKVLGKLNDAQQELIKTAKDDAQRLKNFVKNLLDISKLESGKYNFKFQDIYPVDLIERATKSFQIALTEKQINFKTKMEKRCPKFWGDFEYLTQVITNLIENAYRHTPERGCITVEVTYVGDMVQFSVSDNGEGIPDEVKDLIFDKFVQLNNFQENEHGNIGLGLAISREIVKAHKGKIWVESKLGEGSQFFFQIPISLRK